MRQPNIAFGWTIGVSACVAVLAASLAVDSFERSQDPKASSFQSPLELNYSVRLSGAFDTPFAGEMVAVRQGLFEQQGLHVQLRPAANSDEAIDLVVRGEDQIGVTSSEEFLMARARGIPIVAFLADLLRPRWCSTPHPTQIFAHPPISVAKKSGIKLDAILRLFTRP